MSGRSSALPWVVIRQDDDGGRYRIGRYATLLEARELAERLAARSGEEADGPDVDVPAKSGTDPGREAGGTRTVSATRVRRYVVERLDYPGGDPA